MKIYIRQIKPYIQPPCLQGFNDSPYPVDGYDWVSEDHEAALRNKIVINDSWSTLIFKERFIALGDGVMGEFEGTQFGNCQNCGNAKESFYLKDEFKDELNCPMWGAVGLNPYGFCHMWKPKE